MVSEPFRWTFGRDDIDKLLARIAAQRTGGIAEGPPATIRSTGNPEAALDCMCGLYLGDVTAWAGACPDS
ncbi:MAG: hypothetical protein ACRDYY_12780 [Acidimicrobiales bacterium]